MIFKKYMIFLFIFIFVISVLLLSNQKANLNITEISIENDTNTFYDDSYVEGNLVDSNIVSEDSDSYIKWVDFKGTSEILSKLSKLDIDSHLNNAEVKLNWIELMALLSCKYGGDFSKFKQTDLDNIVNDLNNSKTASDLGQNYKLYNYYYTSLDAIFHEYLGYYTIQVDNGSGEKTYKESYGLKVFSPIAKGYYYNHYKDFGASRSYGYKRTHLGNDILGSLGTPIIAVESGYIESLGWNQYGGWRVGIRSFDKKRYYYYAHLRKDHPFARDLCEGQIVNAGDVIGYMGMTGYSATENVNNINIIHLHFGLQLIFNEVQKEGTNQIWIDVYEIIEFLRKNTSQIYLAYPDSSDYERAYDYMYEE